MPEKCKDCCSRLFCMSVAEVNGEDFETMANKKVCKKRVFTNADRIRTMTDEELARFLCCTGWRLPERKECLEWLQRTAGGESRDE